jgi:hypothetical protein
MDCNVTALCNYAMLLGRGNWTANMAGQYYAAEQYYIAVIHRHIISLRIRAVLLCKAIMQ